MRAQISAALNEPGTPLADVELLAPVDPDTEVWAAGVTYERSLDARVLESSQGDVYSRVYDADRPELFFKAIGWRVVADGEPIAVRGDSTLTVPEPELALVVNSAAQIVGYAVANDVTSRSIEGANPLYLPQAKMYDSSCALSTAITPSWEVESPVFDISCEIRRGTSVIWSASTSTARMHRALEDLVSALYAEITFPAGAFLLTGAGIVPDLDVTLEAGDVVTIDIDGLGSLTNPVRRRAELSAIRG
ncbi:MAG: fumarylacetoacetate hydrolase family protein [Mycobacteriales bacterium]